MYNQQNDIYTVFVSVTTSQRGNTDHQLKNLVLIKRVVVPPLIFTKKNHSAHADLIFKKESDVNLACAAFLFCSISQICYYLFVLGLFQKIS